MDKQVRLTKLESKIRSLQLSMDAMSQEEYEGPDGDLLNKLQSEAVREWELLGGREYTYVDAEKGGG